MRASFALGLALSFAACGGKVASAPSAGSPEEESGGSGEGEGRAASPPPSGGPNPTPSAASPPCVSSFLRDVMPALQRASCSLEACHGGPSPPGRPRIEPKLPQDTYDGFVAFRVSSGQPYIVPGATDISRHGMDCNLRGACGILMPLGLDAPRYDLIGVVDGWLSCGAPYD